VTGIHVLATLAALWSAHQRWPTLEELADELDVAPSAELERHYDRLREAAEALIEKLESRRNARVVVTELYGLGTHAIVVTTHGMEEGLVTELDDEGFRIGNRRHWIWWSDLERAAQKVRGIA
jgi:hypothetical protein